MDVRPNGRIRLNFPRLDVTELTDCCALDVAQRGGLTLDETGQRMNLTRERIRHIEGEALEKVRAALEGLR